MSCRYIKDWHRRTAGSGYGSLSAWIVLVLCMLTVNECMLPFVMWINIEFWLSLGSLRLKASVKFIWSLISLMNLVHCLVQLDYPVKLIFKFIC